jgi:pectate lyase
MPENIRVFRRSVCWFALLASLLLAAPLAHGEPLAFPGAEGFGRHAKGGRGGKVLFVTNLNDSGPGSLREAIDTPGPRTVIFRVSGVIELKKHIFIREPYLTIAGQTAPGEGICVGKNMIMVFGAHDVIIRHLRVRSGDVSGKEVDTLSIKDGTNVIVDHCSACWSVDENVSVTGESDHVTVQWCIIADSLNKSVHSKGPHGYGSLISLIPDGRVTYHHNLYAHNASRNPRPGGLPEKPGVLLDFRNNVIYDWGHHSGYSNDTACRINYVGNYLKAGPSTQERMRRFAFAPGSNKTKIFLVDNYMVGEDAKNADNRLLIQPFREQKVEEYLVDKPFDYAPVRTDDPKAACDKVLTAAGAMLPRRDAYDQRIIDDVRHGTGRIIDSQKEVGGWPTYPPAQPYQDDNHNGLPDDWEARYRVSDPNADPDGDGYTNLEEFLNGTDPNRAD